MHYGDGVYPTRDLQRSVRSGSGLETLFDAAARSGVIDEPAMRAGFACIAVSNLANLQQHRAASSFWVQVCGACRIQSEEGRFRLQRGDWIAFDRDSKPNLQAEHRGLTLGLVLWRDISRDAGTPAFHPGKGTLPFIELRLWLRLWRACAQGSRAGGDEAARALEPLLLHVQALQYELDALAARCPGRTSLRKAQIFARLQRVRMCQEGNPHRMVRMDELAGFSRVSNWWLSKTYHRVYGESPQQASMRLRMARARDLLKNTDLPICELSEVCGFHDPCSFARQFKACHGQAASAWRDVARREAEADADDRLVRFG